MRQVRSFPLRPSLEGLPFLFRCRTVFALPLSPLCLILLGLAQVATAQDIVSPADLYEGKIKAVLKERCYACHGALKQEGDLRLDTVAAMRMGGSSGPGVVAGNITESVLWERVSAADQGTRMPPEGEPLTAEQLAALRTWIDQGAVAPPNDLPEPDPRQHWAFLVPVRPDVPQRDSSPFRHPIDAFLEAKRVEQKLGTVKEAAPEVWLRRVTIDLIGIPPTREQLHAYLADKSPDAAERVVDRLLADPRYGERWGRHWMDVWRYSDWYGRRSVPDVMNSYPQIWRWRDWIVQSLNQDVGYDRMIEDMVAADELRPGDAQSVVATGYLVRNWFKWNYEQWMKDNVEHTGKAFLGLTMNCAHCHDHKYDPITHEDYFRFRAFFEPLELRQDRVPGLADPGPFKKYVYAQSYGPIQTGLIRVFDEKLDAETYMYAGGDNRQRLEGKPPVTASVPALFAEKMLEIQPIELAPEAYYPGLQEFVRHEERQKLAHELAPAVATLQPLRVKQAALDQKREQARTGSEEPPSAEALVLAEQEYRSAMPPWQLAEAMVAEVQARIDSLEARIVADDAKYRKQGDPSLLSAKAAAAEKLVAVRQSELRRVRAVQGIEALANLPASDPDRAKKIAAAQAESAAAQTALTQARKALETPGDSYTPLSPLYPSRTTGRRAALAKWMTDQTNPLTARVAVNHLWQRHFGRGLVATPTDFGRNGRPPTHPELLDWLAVELREQGWSMKALHRQIVTSQAYRLRSDLGTASDTWKSTDPDNQAYWRFSSLRLEAEAIRDSLLACSESLDGRMGGQEIDFAQGLAVPRRSLYFTIHGEAQMEFLAVFDGPNVADCYQRSTSIRPQQALAMANNDLVQQQSALLAERLLGNQSLSAETSLDRIFVTAAFEQILSRAPRGEEQAAAQEFLNQQRQLYATMQPDVAAANRQACASLLLVLFNHNDFVTVR